jgi:hypothetical protein
VAAPANRTLPARPGVQRTARSARSSARRNLSSSVVGRAVCRAPRRGRARPAAPAIRQPSRTSSVRSRLRRPACLHSCLRSCSKLSGSSSAERTGRRFGRPAGRSTVRQPTSSCPPDCRRGPRAFLCTPVPFPEPHTYFWFYHGLFAARPTSLQAHAARPTSLPSLSAGTGLPRLPRRRYLATDHPPTTRAAWPLPSR